MNNRSIESHPAALERRSLFYSVLANGLIALVGLVMAWQTDSEAILLDGLFNLVYVFVGLFTLKVADLLLLGDDARFPMGYAYFEPLVNGIKGMLVLGISLLAGLSAIHALLSGGRPIGAGGAVLYGAFAAAAGWIMAAVIARGARATASPLLRVDFQNWILNGAISSAVFFAFIGTWFLSRSAHSQYAAYVDPLLVLVVVGLSISVPVRMARDALLELLNRAPSREVVDEVSAEIADELSELPLRELVVRIVQPGRTRMVLAHVVLPPDQEIESLERMDAIRHAVRRRLERKHSPVELDLVFTADPEWGAPRNRGRGA